MISRADSASGSAEMTGRLMKEACSVFLKTVTVGGGDSSGVEALSLSAQVRVIRIRWPELKTLEVG
jgi:hypothetical protein